MTNWIYRVDITVYTGGSTQVLHYATRSYATTAAHPTLPNALFDDRVIQPLLLRRELYGEGRTHGPMVIAHGEVILDNSDGGLDFLRVGYGLDARKIDIIKVDPSSLDADSLVFRGVMEDFELDFDKLTIQVRDLTCIYDKALQPTKFAGSNSLPAGLEGTASDLKGKPKPKVFGSVFNVEPPLVNTSRLIYQINDTSLLPNFVLTVYDKRVTLAAGILRTLTEMQNASTVYTVTAVDTTLERITVGTPVSLANGTPVHVASSVSLPGGVLDTQYYYARNVSAGVHTLHPTAADAVAGTNTVNLTSAGSGTITMAVNRTPFGNYDWCNDANGSYLRTGSQATRLTCDISNGAAGVGDTFDAVLGQILSAAASQYSDITALSFMTVNRFSSSVRVGFWWDQEMTYYQALSELAESENVSVQGYTDTGGLNQLIVQRLIAGGSGTAFPLDENNIKLGSLKRVRSQDPERVPPWRITCEYSRNYTVMTPSDLAGIAAAQVVFTGIEYRSVNYDTLATKTYYPSSPELIIVTGLVLEADATDLASNYFVGLVGTPDRQMLQATMSLDDFNANLVLAPFTYGALLGETRYSITNSRLGFGGSNFAPLAYVLDYQAGTADLTLWG
jgi:hypothetical protein